MASFNKVMLIGNLTRDPELRYTPKGNAVADIRLAINRYYTLDNGEKKEETTFVDVVLWSRQAELAKQYLSKGKPVFIEGRLQLDQWDDKTTGEHRSRLRVVCEKMQFLGSAPSGNAQGQKTSSDFNDSNSYGSNPANNSKPQSDDKKPDNSPQYLSEDGEDDIPF